MLTVCSLLAPSCSKDAKIENTGDFNFRVRSMVPLKSSAAFHAADTGARLWGVEHAVTPGLIRPALLQWPCMVV